MSHNHSPHYSIHCLVWWSWSSPSPHMEGCMQSWVVSHLALNIGMLHHTLAYEFTTPWRQTLYQTQEQHLHFYHDSVWLFDLILLFVCQTNLSCELWNRKLKLKINKVYSFKSLHMVWIGWWQDLRLLFIFAHPFCILCGWWVKEG